MQRRTEAFRPDAPIVPELAAGAVLTRADGSAVFLLHQADEDRWCLPKGHVDPGESLAAAALREVREETGFRAVTLGEEISEVSYRFYRPRRGINVHKSVVYFLGYTAEREPQLESTFDRGAWVPLGEAARRVDYALDRTVVEAARFRLEERSKKPEGKG